MMRIFLYYWIYTIVASIGLLLLLATGIIAVIDAAPITIHRSVRSLSGNKNYTIDNTLSIEQQLELTARLDELLITGCQYGGTDYSGLNTSPTDYSLIGSNPTYNYYVQLCGSVSNAACVANNPQSSICQAQVGGASYNQGGFNLQPPPVWSYINSANPSLGIQQVYTNGDNCAPGPNGGRQATIIIKCGIQSQTFTWNESPTCVYTITMTSPAACGLPPPAPAPSPAPTQSLPKPNSCTTTPNTGYGIWLGIDSAGSGFYNNSQGIDHIPITDGHSGIIVLSLSVVNSTVFQLPGCCSISYYQKTGSILCYTTSLLPKSTGPIISIEWE